jgi:hypothetical protein
MRLAILLMVAGVGAAQTQTQPAGEPPSGSIGGVVRDAESQTPVENVTVFTGVSAAKGRPGRQVMSTTDKQGRYALKDLPPAQYTVYTRVRQFGYSDQRMATLAPGQDLTLDFRARMGGTITGTVTDDNKEPMPEVDVYLVTKEYFLGSLRYYLRSSARTDDRGRYAMEGLTPGVPYLIMTRNRVLHPPAISDAPEDQKLRRKAFAPTFYPNATTMDGGAPVTLRSAERREGIDLSVQRTPSYCVEGATQAAVATRLELVEDQPSMGVRSDGGTYFTNPTADTAADGKFRFCGLHPGAYRLTAMQMPKAEREAPLQYGVTAFAIRDEDLHGLKAALAPGADLNGEFVWDGPAPAADSGATANFGLDRLYGWRMGGENLEARGDVPSEFTVKSVPADEYVVRVSVRAPGMYVKDVTYGGNSVMYSPLKMGSAIGDASVKVIVARDAGGAAALVTEEDKPVGDAQVYFFPQDVRNEAELQARIASGATDQNGNYQTGVKLAPGKYYAIAAMTKTDATPESVGKLWRARTKAKEVDIAAGQTAQVSLEPVSIE